MGESKPLNDVLRDLRNCMKNEPPPYFIELLRRAADEIERLQDGHELYPVFDKIERLLLDGYYISHQDDLWHIFRSDGCGMYYGRTFRELCVNIVMSDDSDVSWTKRSHQIRQAVKQFAESVTMSEDLKPCPFCGSNEFTILQNLDTFRVCCLNRECDVTVCGSTKDEATERWNRRAT